MKITIFITISPKYDPKPPINNKPVLVQIVAWCQTGDEPLSGPIPAYFTDSYMRLKASVGQ